MILLIDNYDSFTYNLYQYIGTFTPDIRVVRNDAITIGEIEDMQPERCLLYTSRTMTGIRFWGNRRN